jgi:hypothetical protein
LNLGSENFDVVHKKRGCKKVLVELDGV